MLKGNKIKAMVLISAAFISMILGIGIGSVWIPPSDILQILSSFFFRLDLPEEIEPLYFGMVTGLRLPRVITAFLAGTALSVSGTVMQSILKNPLASSYGLGVSSGAGLGAAIIMVSGLAAGSAGNLLLPATATLFGLLSVAAAMGIAYYMNKSLSDHTIILTGMVLSLFLNAILNTLATLNSRYTHQILLWQLGTFAGKEWNNIFILFFVIIVCLLIFQCRSEALDLISFGEETALTAGVDIKREKWFFIIMTSILTGTAVSFVGIIGFVDLISPHIVRRFFGASHKWVIPMSALFGGTFMVLCDLVGRTAASPGEIPAGTITALIGAPFFLYLYFMSKKHK